MGVLGTLGQLLLLFLPVGLSVAAVVWEQWALLPVSVLLLLILVRTLPLCRGDEVPWAVLLSAPAGLPVNLLLVREFAAVFWTEIPSWAIFLRGSLALYGLFSVETIILGIFAYLLRARKKIP